MNSTMIDRCFALTSFISAFIFGSHSRRSPVSLFVAVHENTRLSPRTSDSYNVGARSFLSSQRCCFYLFEIFRRRSVEAKQRGLRLNDIAVRVHSSQLRDVTCHYETTQSYLPPDTRERVPHNPPPHSQKGWCSNNLPRKDGRLSSMQYLI